MIRPARPDEHERLSRIEDAAAQMFHGTAMAFVLERPSVPPVHGISETQVQIWVSCDTDDQPVGFLEAQVIEGWLHILELSVHPDHQRQGRARALVETAVAQAAQLGLSTVSLTTDRLIPWNGPAYLRMGFAPLPPIQCPAWLTAILQQEVAAGFDPLRRIAMARQP